MSTTPTANTLLPPAVRVAKLLGTVGSAYAAGSLLTTSLVFLPSVSITSPRDLALTLESVRSRMHRPLLLITSASAGAYAFLAYYLYTTPPLSIPLASIAFHPGSFLPHGEATTVLVGAGWELYAAAAAAVGCVLPWQVFGVAPVERRIQSAGEGVRVAEERGLKTKIVDASETLEDLESWRKGVRVKGVLAAVGAVVGAYAVAWW
ncbi:hypothetical protein K440DRAFT_658862 [Wilcoxina mikolae CBS 423.85]|nr:hypothetical protein K440DRAFT_658862 [Wilcoxina mikolae CBS 423.85]